MSNLSNSISSTLEPRQRNQSLALNNNHDDFNKVKTDSSLTVFIFATVKRSDVKAKPVMKRVTASNYKDARQQLIRDYVISFAGCIPSKVETV